MCRCKREETRPILPTPAPTCPPMIYCLIPCDFGSIPDENGCDTCNCLPEPAKCPKLDRRCAFGSVLDENGCETYDCLPVACRSVYCFIPCLHGSIPDENGCETCNCLPAPTSTYLLLKNLNVPFSSNVSLPVQAATSATATDVRPASVFIPQPPADQSGKWKISLI